MDVAVRYGGLGLAEVVKDREGVRYQAAAQAVKPFGEAMAEDPKRREFLSKLKPSSWEVLPVEKQVSGDWRQRAGGTR